MTTLTHWYNGRRIDICQRSIFTAVRERTEHAAYIDGRLLVNHRGAPCIWKSRNVALAAAQKIIVATLVLKGMQNAESP